jgi:nitronate monooxygenase
LRDRSDRQVAFTLEPVGEHLVEYGVGARRRPVYLTAPDFARAKDWEDAGFTEAMRTPDSTLIFVAPEKAEEIHADQVNCMGCLSQCRFSNWSQEPPNYDNGKKADPRSFCIQKTLQDIAHADPADETALDNNLMFAGHNAYRFGSDPFYSNGFIPTVRELVERLLTGK